MLLVERSSGEEGPRYFLNRFLGADRVLDKRDQTKLFRRQVEVFARQALKNDIDKAEEVRCQSNEELLGSAYIDIGAFTSELFSNEPEAREKLEKKLQAAGLPLDGRIEVDRLWVNEKMRKRTIKTDTGFF